VIVSREQLQTGNGIQDGRLHFQEVAGEEEVAQTLDDAASQLKRVANLGVDDQVPVSLPAARLGVAQRQLVA